MEPCDLLNVTQELFANIPKMSVILCNVSTSVVSVWVSTQQSEWREQEGKKLCSTESVSVVYIVKFTEHLFMFLFHELKQTAACISA